MGQPGGNCAGFWRGCNVLRMGLVDRTRFAGQGGGRGVHLDWELWRRSGWEGRVERLVLQMAAGLEMVVRLVTSTSVTLWRSWLAEEYSLAVVWAL